MSMVCGIKTWEHVLRVVALDNEYVRVFEALRSKSIESIEARHMCGLTLYFIFYSRVVKS